MTIQKRDKRKRRESKALAYPPENKAILEPIEVKGNRICPKCQTITGSAMCPNCGRITVFRGN